MQTTAKTGTVVCHRHGAIAIQVCLSFTSVFISLAHCPQAGCGGRVWVSHLKRKNTDDEKFFKLCRELVKDGALQLDANAEIVGAMMTTHDGKVLRA